MEIPKVISLNGNGWKYKYAVGKYPEFQKLFHPAKETSDWNTATVPGAVQADLLANGEIDDPYKDLNSRAAEWVSQRRWTYRKTFHIEESLMGGKIRLRFEGVDYESYYYLNGEYLGFHKGMFAPVEFDITRLVNYGSDNELAVIISRMPDEESQVGHTSRVRTGKTRMTYGWDFATRLVPLGIWDDVNISITGETHIDDVWVRSRLEEDLSRAVVLVKTSVDSQSQGRLRVEARLKFGSKEIGRTAITLFTFGGKTEINLDFMLDEPRLWWPNGYGDQNLYDVEVSVYNDHDEGISDVRNVRFGIRKIEMISNQDSGNARPYTLRVNSRRVFMKGWNWVPADHLYGTVDEGKYKKFLRLAAQVNLKPLPQLHHVPDGNCKRKYPFPRLIGAYQTQ